MKVQSKFNFYCSTQRSKMQHSETLFSTKKGFSVEIPKNKKPVLSEAPAIPLPPFGGARGGWAGLRPESFTPIAAADACGTDVTALVALGVTIRDGGELLKDDGASGLKRLRSQDLRHPHIRLTKNKQACA
ncbi:MAG: hypothetical protein SOZ49_07870 [Clostridiaceae bacterium]|nr:hypothetical protein [Clostridia bacterium]MDY3871131.1 hypothetical protein [Clostridiaceae bacterium]